MAKAKAASVSSGAKPKEKMKLWKKILIGVGIFILLVVGLSFSATSGIVDVAEKQLNLIGSGDMKGAYALTSQEFQRSVTYDNFLAYVNNYVVLKNYKDHSFSSREIQGATGTISGTLTATDGTVTPVEYQLIKENDTWKILSLNLSSSAGTNPTPTSPAAATPTPNATSPAANSKSAANPSGDLKTFADPALGYNIQLPNDWTFEKKDSVTALFSGPQEKDMFDVTINIQNLTSTNRGGQYADNDDVVKDLKKQLKDMDKNATFSDITDITFTRSDGMELTAKSFASELVIEGKKFVIMQVVVPHGDSLTFHALGYTAPAEKFDTHLDLVQSILETWEINK